MSPKKTTQLKELWNRKGNPFAIVFPQSVSGAQELEALGYEAIFLGAGAVLGNNLGLPDNGTITLTESVSMSKYYADALEIPVFVDVDACFGGIFQVERAVREFIKAGIAGLFIEDQPYEGKRFGGMVGKEVIPLEEAVAKYRVAVDTKNALDPDFQIIARCDALTASNSDGLSETITRMQAYEAAGADVMFVEGPRSFDEIRAVRAAVKGPLFCTPYNLGDDLSIEDAKELGLAALIYFRTGGILRSFRQAFLKSVLETGSHAAVEFQRLVDSLPATNARMQDKRAQLRDFEEKYLPASMLEKYKTVPEGKGIVGIRAE